MQKRSYLGTNDILPRQPECTLTPWHKYIKRLIQCRCNTHKTLGVVGVVRVLVADAHNTSRGQKVPNFDCNPLLFIAEQSRCPPYLYKNFERKRYLQFGKIWQTIFDPDFPVVKSQKNRNLTSGVVLLCWILLHNFSNCYTSTEAFLHCCMAVMAAFYTNVAVFYTRRG